MTTIMLKLPERDVVLDIDKICHIDKVPESNLVEIYALRMDNPLVIEFETHKEVDDAFKKLVDIWTGVPIDGIKQSRIFVSSKL